MRKNIVWILTCLFLVAGWSGTTYLLWQENQNLKSNYLEIEKRIISQDSEISTLRSQLNIAAEKNTKLISELTLVTAKNRNTETKLSNTQQELHDEKAKLPIIVKFRSASWGAGEVMILRNKSEKFISLDIQITNPTTGKSARFQPQLQPNSTFEIGHMEGWAFSTGDKFTIESSGFTTISAATP